MNFLLAISLSFVLTISPNSDLPEKGIYALTHATIHTVSGETIPDGTLVITDDTITAIGSSIEIPAGAEIIDCSGLHIYPGFIDGGTGLGLVEVGSQPETNDRNEVGSNTRGTKANRTKGRTCHLWWAPRTASVVANRRPPLPRVMDFGGFWALSRPTGGSEFVELLLRRFHFPHALRYTVVMPSLSVMW